MAHYSRIDTMVRAVVLSRPKKIAICPFAEEGMMAKQILNWRYGIEETYIVDNRLAEINSDILSMEDLKDRNPELPAPGVDGCFGKETFFPKHQTASAGREAGGRIPVYTVRKGI